MSQAVTLPPRVAAMHGAPTLRHRIEELLATAQIEINGSRPWDIQLRQPGVLERVAWRGSLGLGEAYMDGHWDAEQLDGFFHRVLRAKLDRQVQPWRVRAARLPARWINCQTIRRAWHVGKAHYDLGNDFYQMMLGPSMAYSCGYWRSASSLAEAQDAKLDLICQKLRLKPGMRLLDIGCGWGSLLGHAARHYGVTGVGITVSRKQLEYAQQHHADLPVEFRFQDYRELDGRFDRIASIGMFEHVGHKNYRTFMQVARRCLVDDGLLLLHTIGKTEEGNTSDPWIEKYIFPNGEIPSLVQISKAIAGLFITEDIHNIGAYYDPTLMAWHANFEAGWPQFATKLGERFHRQWRYYLLSCAGAFRARDLQVWQWLLAKNGVVGGWPRCA